MSAAELDAAAERLFKAGLALSTATGRAVQATFTGKDFPAALDVEDAAAIEHLAAATALRDLIRQVDRCPT